MKAVVVLFGSFNPVHKGHIAVADNAIEELQADGLWFVVSPENPFKDHSTLAPEADRLAMVEIAIRSARHADMMQASDVEFSMPRPSRTVDTLGVLSERFPECKFTLLIGADNAGKFEEWKNASEIVENYRIAVYPREGYPIESKYSDRFVYLKNAPLEPEAATSIRQRIAEGAKNIADLPRGVEDYIRTHGLYVCPCVPARGDGGTPEAIDERIERLGAEIEMPAGETCKVGNFLERGKLHYRKGSFDLALNDFLQVLELDRDNEEAREYRDLLREILSFRYTDIYNP